MKPKTEKILKSSIEYAPIIFTVGFGGYVTLQHQFQPFTDTQLLAWILAIISLLSTSILVDRFSRLNRIEKSTATILHSLSNSGSLSIDSILATRKTLPALEERLSQSKKIYIAGGSLLRLTNEYLNFFESKAKANCSLKFLLLSPESEAVKFVAESIVYEINNHEQYRSSVQTSLDNLKKLQKSYPNQVEVRLYDIIPAFSILGSEVQRDEESEIMIEFYTYQTPTRERPHIILKKGSDPNWFLYFNNQFELLWKAGVETNY